MPLPKVCYKPIFEPMKITSLLIALFIISLNLNAQILDGIAAVVGEDIILFSDLEYQHQYMV